MRKPKAASASTGTTKAAESSATKRKSTKKAETSEPKAKQSLNDILPSKVKLKCKNVKQKDFVQLIATSDIVIASGPAGTGKSYTAIAKGLELLQSNQDQYHKLVIVKPAVESEESYGFLPGSLKEKMEPHLASSMDIVDKLVGMNKRLELEAAGILRVELLGFLRGKTIDNTILIMEEAQNMSPNQMKTLLTRIGENTKYVISGDLDQSDKYANVTHSGLYDAISRHKNIDEIKFFEFDVDDIVRNPLITKILKNYKKEVPNSNNRIVPNQEFKSNMVPNRKPEPKKEKTWFQRNFGWFIRNFSW